ncbi:MAG TPA: protease pro-enzyme activation domain-containing protein [Rhodanobacter sp.]
MKQSYFILSASIAAALASTSAFAQPAVASSQALAGINTAEAARVTQAVNANVVSAVQNSRLKFVNKAKPVSQLADSTPMNHLQLILKRSALREAALTQFMADQHNPKSSKFQQWLTPQQFGEAFGVADSDIEAAKAWLGSQGFTVHGVYPNKMQIDFSGNAGQVNRTFHTQENRYTLKNGTSHVANARDISIPSALSSVVVGVAGLNDFHPKALLKPSKAMKLDPNGKGLSLKPLNAPIAAAKTGKKGQAISFTNGARGLVPNDIATMYNFKSLRPNGVTGAGITIAVIEDADMVAADWPNFVSQFNLGQYGGTFTVTHPAGPSTCDAPPTPTAATESGETVLDAEWATAVAPGAAIVVASCADTGNDNFFGGVFAAGTNLINATTRPNIISASYGFGEYFTDTASKSAIDLMWAQADAEGISVFVSTGDSGSNPSFNGGVINGYYGNSAVDANSFATSANVTAVGGTDTADVLDGTTSQYFAPVASVVGGSALSYVPEIPWNQSCGNGVAVKALGYSSAIDFCNADLNGDVDPALSPGIQSEAGSGGPSSVVRKPAWQRQIFNAARDQSRDLPDVALFAGSFGGLTWAIDCTAKYPCSPDWSGNISVTGGTSLSSPMFAGIQALISQGLVMRGLQPNQGNAAPTLYALAANEYGNGLGATPASLATCNSDNGATGTSACVFHNITRGSISSSCYDAQPFFSTSNCYYYASLPGSGYTLDVGLTTTDSSPTAYANANKAFIAQPGWSFATGLGSVDTRNLLIAWRAFVNAPAAAPTAVASK